MFSPSLHAWSTLARQARLLRRHVRFGRASFTRTPNPRRTAALEIVFRTVNTHLRKLNVDYALAYGTLLGWHRERAVLAHDYDVDFAAPVAAYSAIKASAHGLPAGFALHDTTHRHHGPKLYFAYQGWEADIYFYTEENGQLRSTERSRNPGEYLPFPREFFFPRQPAVFLGEATFVPANPLALLTHHYRYLGADAVRDPVTRYFRPRQSSP